MPGKGPGTEAPVWARNGAALAECPKSSISAESLTLVEEFSARRQLGGMEFSALTARQVDAFTILERELATERADGQQQPRDASR
jgi:hypothetical protein